MMKLSWSSSFAEVSGDIRRLAPEKIKALINKEICMAVLGFIRGILLV